MRACFEIAILGSRVSHRGLILFLRSHLKSSHDSSSRYVFIVRLAARGLSAPLSTPDSVLVRKPARKRNRIPPPTATSDLNQKRSFAETRSWNMAFPPLEKKSPFELKSLNLTRHCHTGPTENVEKHGSSREGAKRSRIEGEEDKPTQRREPKQPCRFLNKIENKF